MAQELHPDEGTVRELDAEDWLAYFSEVRSHYSYQVKQDFFLESDHL
jgi:hypothetical protein